MAVASDNLFPKVIIVEGSAPASPASGNQVLYIDSADHKLKRKNSSGTVTAIEYTAASFVGARYTTNAGQSTSTAGNVTVNYEDSVYDTNSAVTTGASWVFTAPSTGYYHVTAKVTWTGTAWTDGKSASMYLYKGVTLVSELDRFIVGSTASASWALSGSDTISLTAGDTIHIEIYQNQGTIVLYNDGAYNFINIEKVG